MNSDGWVSTTKNSFSDSERGVLFKLLSLLGNAKGSDIFADTASHDGTWQKVVALEATVIASITATDIGDGSAVTAQNFAAGAEIVAEITNITLTSGSVIAYRRVSA